MLKLAPALSVIAVAIGIPSTLAFSTTEITARMTMTARKDTLLKYQPEFQPGTQFGAPPPTGDISGAYDRAADCANNFGMCDIDELLDLSEELDEYLGCFVEDGPEACEKEIDDRQDLSEALLVQGEMREHQRYVQDGNIFAYEENGLVNNMDNSNPQPSAWREEGEFQWGGDNSLHM
eukprot:CAMPEP_0181112060 /NCGR_PEP_ID=MMETSP1071-20121207/19613_1 /TAXON_ID=35127 /ORGANISM="Thalassiosira sp., Strain NH16" /LENGTH=177 /DNA_ID=CAMNT_0023196007 /DNA_START=113 /DNA_END=646 /DNA_ORIENTATION=-